MTSHEQLRRHWVATTNLVKPRSNWYSIKNVGSKTELYVYDEIGFFGVTAADFAREIGNLTTSQIDLHINSPGGAASEGVAIFNALSAHLAQVTTIVDGWAASAASVVAMAGDRIEMRPGSLMMIHNASGLCIGDAAEMEKMAQTLRTVTGSIADIYTARRGGKREDWLSAMAEETWYTPAEAVAAGLADAETQPQDREPDNRIQQIVTQAPDSIYETSFDWDAFRSALKEGAWR